MIIHCKKVQWSWRVLLRNLSVPLSLFLPLCCSKVRISKLAFDRNRVQNTHMKIIQIHHSLLQWFHGQGRETCHTNATKHCICHVLADDSATTFHCGPSGGGGSQSSSLMAPQRFPFTRMKFDGWGKAWQKNRGRWPSYEMLWAKCRFLGTTSGSQSWARASLNLPLALSALSASQTSDAMIIPPAVLGIAGKRWRACHGPLQGHVDKLMWRCSSWAAQQYHILWPHLLQGACVLKPSAFPLACTREVVRVCKQCMWHPRPTTSKSTRTKTKLCASVCVHQGWS